MAWRYLFARKSHSAINIISVVSVCGIALATMAMICVLSVYNGFQQYIGASASSTVPDVEVRPAGSRLISDADSLATALAQMPDVEVATPVVDDNMLLYADNRMVPVRVMGVDPTPYSRATSVSRMIADGSYTLGAAEDNTVDAEETTDDADIDAVAAEEFSEADLMADAGDLYAGDEEMTEVETEGPKEQILVGTDIFLQMFGAESAAEYAKATGTPTPEVSLVVPRRTAQISTVNPQNAFLLADALVAGQVRAEKSNFGSGIVLADIALVRSMLEYETEGSAIYLKARRDTSPARLAEEVRGKLGKGYEVRDRGSQLSLHFNMMRIEKMFTYVLLAFILIVASFNIISTLSMFIVDKRENISVLRRLGAPERFIGAVFSWESVIVTGIGTLGGLAAGLFLCWLQIRFGLIGIPDSSGRMLLDTYPVAVEWTDILWLLIPSAIIAFLTARISSRFARRIPATLHY